MESNTEVAIAFIAGGIFLLVLGLCIKVDENEEEDYYKKYKKIPPSIQRARQIVGGVTALVLGILMLLKVI